MREPATGQLFWTDTELLDYVNESIRFMAIDGELFIKKAIINCSASTALYQLNVDTVSVKRVEYDNELITHAHPEVWDEEDEDWQDDEGTPYEYTLQLDDGYIRLYPTPDTDGAGDGSGDNDIRVYTAYVPADLASGDNIPYPVSKDDSTVEFYVLWAAYEKEGATQDLQKSQYYWQRFIQRYRMLKKRDELPRSPSVIGSKTYPNRLRKTRHPLLPDNYPRRW